MSTSPISQDQSPAKASGTAPRALILAAHGERRVADPNRALLEHAAALAGQLPDMIVRCGVLNGEPSLDDALEQVASAGACEILVYPFFMSDGYFVSNVLPKRLKALAPDARWSILTPLGLDPGLPELMMQQALAAAAQAGFEPSGTRLLVTGHGSKSGRASAKATERIARELAGLERFERVATAFLEEPPFVENELAAEKSPVVVPGFFAGNGMHSTQDVPAAIEDSGARAIYAGSVGVSPSVRDLIVASVKQHVGNA